MEDTIDVASKLQRFMKEQLKNLSTIITSGGVDNMEDYKYILGQIRTLVAPRQFCHPTAERSIERLGTTRRGAD